MSSQTFAIENLPDDEFYQDYEKFKIEEIISTEKYNAKYGSLTQEIELISPNFINKVFDKPQDKFIALEKWEGAVTEICESSFFADLYNKKSNTVEEAEFSKEEISDQDFALLKTGAIFYWSIGYLDKVSGQRLKSSIIKFRRLPIWSDQDIEVAQKKADEIIQKLKFE